MKNKEADSTPTLSADEDTTAVAATETDESEETTSRVDQLRQLYLIARRMRVSLQGTHRPWGVEPLCAYLHEMKIDYLWACKMQNGVDTQDQEENRTLTVKSHYEAFLIKQRGHLPIFTYTLISICTIVMVFEMKNSNWVFAPWKENLMLGPSPDSLIRMGALYSPSVVYDHEWYRLVAAMFMHAGIFHYLTNMVGVAFVGTLVERHHGSWLTCFVFLASALAANIFGAIYGTLTPNAVRLGASGGLFSWTGWCLADALVNWGFLCQSPSYPENHFPRHVVVFWMVIEITVVSAMGIIPSIDNFAHIGGLWYGALLGLAVLPRYSRGHPFVKKDGRGCQCLYFALRFLACALLIFSLAGTIVELVTLDDGEEPRLSWLSYVSCVTFRSNDPWWDCGDTDDTDDLCYMAILYVEQQNQVKLVCPLEGLEIAVSDATLQNDYGYDTSTHTGALLETLVPALCRAFCPK